VRFLRATYNFGRAEQIDVQGLIQKHEAIGASSHAGRTTGEETAINLNPLTVAQTRNFSSANLWWKKASMRSVKMRNLRNPLPRPSHPPSSEDREEPRGVAAMARRGPSHGKEGC
jgi:hypothetical protein